MQTVLGSRKIALSFFIIQGKNISGGEMIVCVNNYHWKKAVHDCLRNEISVQSRKKNARLNRNIFSNILKSFINILSLKIKMIERYFSSTAVTIVI